MSKKILIVNGHPMVDSFCSALARRYADAAREAGAEVRHKHLATLNFDPILHQGYLVIQQLEPDLLELKEDILWAGHLVFAFPVWWGTPPALMKGFFDRLFVPGFAYKYPNPKAMFQEKLLKGRSARVICTMDSPGWYYRWVVGAPGLKMMKRSILNFCGISPVRMSTFGSVKLASKERREKWLATAASLGRECR